MTLDGKKMNILFFANLIPYPLDNGGKIKTFSTIEALSREHTIDLVCFYEKENIIEAKKVLEKYCRKVILVPIKVTTRENMTYMMKKAIGCLFSKFPLIVYKYWSKEMRKTVAGLVAENHYDVTYFNYLQIYTYKDVIRKISPNMKFVLDMQNCETRIFQRHAHETNNFLKQVYLLLESYKLSLFEKHAVQNTDRLIVLSDEDQTALEELCGNKLLCAVIPIAVKEPGYVKTIDDAKEDIDILFLGTLTWAPNNEGMIWFMQKVMPMLNDKLRFHLYVVGKNPSSELKSLVEKYSNITLTGYVDEVRPYYEKCDFLVVPLFVGSGQRVKIIEAFSYGMPVVSTSIGAEGLDCVDGENILIADSEMEFTEKIVQLCDKKLQRKLSENGRILYDEKYTVDAIAKRINDVVNSLALQD